MVCWGMTTVATMQVTSVTQLAVLRFALGAFEAGFVPGVLLYLMSWYPAARRARVTAVFMLAYVIAGILAGPLSGAILAGLEGAGGLAGWQWMFILEGAPSVLLGLCIFAWLPDGPDGAGWLSLAGRGRLRDILADDSAASVRGTQAGWRDLLADRKVVLLCAAAFSLYAGSYAVAFWLPDILRRLSIRDPWSVGMTSALPFVVGGVAMVLAGHHSDATCERRLHCSGAMVVAATALGLLPMADGRTALGVLLLCGVSGGIFAALPVFWSVPGTLLAPRMAAAGIALINSVGILGGLVGTYVVGLAKSLSGELFLATMPVAVFMLGGALAILAATRASGAEAGSGVEGRAEAPASPQVADSRQLARSNR